MFITEDDLCDDGISCTKDICSEEVGCIHVNQDSLCSDSCLECDPSDGESDPVTGKML